MSEKNLSKPTRKPFYICCHLGARSHYDFPKSMNKSRQLGFLITDVWISSQSLFYKLFKSYSIGVVKKFLQRYDSEIGSDKVISFNLATTLFEIKVKIFKLKGWSLLLHRNIMFQNNVVNALKRIYPTSYQRPIVFSFSYTALKPFQYAKEKGWETILFQIDTGTIEECILEEEYKDSNVSWTRAPEEYWKNWRKELTLADKIIVNSNWSRKALLSLDVPEHKIVNIPLSYSPMGGDNTRNYPVVFRAERPLRVLFLGNIALRKGVGHLLEAIELVSGLPIEFTFVGNSEMSLPLQIGSIKLNLIPPVSRNETAHYYKNADVFIFPTLSDGFGLTQLEALSWQLPVIASKFCGDVVEHDFSGLLLDEVTAESIAASLKFIIDNPSKLEFYSKNTTETLKKFSRDKFENALSNIFN